MTLGALIGAGALYRVNTVYTSMILCGPNILNKYVAILYISEEIKLRACSRTIFPQ